MKFNDPKLKNEIFVRIDMKHSYFSNYSFAMIVDCCLPKIMHNSLFCCLKKFKNKFNFVYVLVHRNILMYVILACHLFM